MKKLMLICAPASSRSGYGDHARDLIHSFSEFKDYDILIMDVRWGDCPKNALDSNNSKDKFILDRILQPQQMRELNTKPEVYVDIRIPNEFQQLGKYNIGITAGVETDVISQEWIEGCNKMDLVIVPSEHAKAGIVSTSFDKIQQFPDGKQEKVGELKVTTPVEVVFEGVRDDIFKPLESKDIPKKLYNKIDRMVHEDFAFLFLGQWCGGGFGQDRKDIGRMIKVFYESFANKKKQPALILKTNGAGFSVMDSEEIKTKIKNIKSMFPSEWNLPNVYLLHGSLSTEEINGLYNHPKVKCMVSLTHGEGFGRPLLEATMTGLPVIASGWSGQMDFLDKQNSLLLDGELKQISKEAFQPIKGMTIQEARWFTVNEGSAYRAYNEVFNQHSLWKGKAKQLMDKNRNKFTLEGMTKLLKNKIDKFLEKTPTQVSLNLPKLSKSKPKKEVEVV